jgi:peroxiredoxin
MQLKAGDKAPDFKLECLDGTTVRLSDYQGKKLFLSFYRFASCPFCNLRVHAIGEFYPQIQAEMEVLGVFESSLDLLQEYMPRHGLGFKIASDTKSESYRKYGVSHSFMGMLSGMLLRMPTLIKAMFKGYLPLKIDSSLTRMPADFIIDEKGIILVAYYAKDEGDHLNIEEILKYTTK